MPWGGEAIFFFFFPGEPVRFYAMVDSVEAMGGPMVAIHLDAVLADYFDARADVQDAAPEKALALLRIVSTQRKLGEFMEDESPWASPGVPVFHAHLSSHFSRCQAPRPVRDRLPHREATEAARAANLDFCPQIMKSARGGLLPVALRLKVGMTFQQWQAFPLFEPRQENGFGQAM